jgi:hypothetical protein
MKRMSIVIGIVILAVLASVALLTPVETRLSIARNAIESKADDGFGDTLKTAETIIIEGELGIVDKINKSTIDQIVNNYKDLYELYEVVTALKYVDELHRINKTAVSQFLQERYDTSGGFKEPMLPWDGVLRSLSLFPIQFRCTTEQQLTAWSKPNMISTYLALTVAKDCNIALDELSIKQFVTRCWNDVVGAFQPFPGKVNPNEPFDVDVYGTGIPYTFAGIKCEKLLQMTINEPTKVRDYVLRCNETFDTTAIADGREIRITAFDIHTNSLPRSYTEVYTNFALSTLDEVGVLSDTEVLPYLKNVKNYILDQQLLSGDKRGLWVGKQLWDEIPATMVFVLMAKLIGVNFNIPTSQGCQTRMTIVGFICIPFGSTATAITIWINRDLIKNRKPRG